MDGEDFDAGSPLEISIEPVEAKSGAVRLGEVIAVLFYEASVMS